MSKNTFRSRFLAALFLLPCISAALHGQETPAAVSPSRADLLRGAYGPYRANNDLLSYHLDIRVVPEKKFIEGKNTIRFKMLADGTRIQLDLHRALHIDKILFNGVQLHYRRDAGAVFINFPQTLKAGTEYTIDFYYSGHPVET